MGRNDCNNTLYRRAVHFQRLDNLLLVPSFRHHCSNPLFVNVAMQVLKNQIGTLVQVSFFFEEESPRLNSWCCCCRCCFCCWHRFCLVNVSLVSGENCLVRWLMVVVGLVDRWPTSSLGSCSCCYVRFLSSSGVWEHDFNLRYCCFFIKWSLEDLKTRRLDPLSGYKVNYSKWK